MTTPNQVANTIAEHVELTDLEQNVVELILENAYDVSGEYNFWAFLDEFEYYYKGNAHSLSGVLGSLVAKGIVTEDGSEPDQYKFAVKMVDAEGNVQA